MERISLNFIGENFSNQEKANFKAKLGYYLGDGPSDASACCCMSYTENAGYACNLRVHSAKGHFFVHRKSQNLERLIQFILESMNRSFKDWKRDPDHFAKSHPLAKVPCKTANHRNIECPLNNFGVQYA